jgi:tetratricopeptide (TPR) repeat protein
MAVSAGDWQRAEPLFEGAVELYEAIGERRVAARASSSLAYVEHIAGRVDRALERMERAYEQVSEDEPDADVALLVYRIAQAHFFRGDPDSAQAWTDRALDLAEALDLPDLLVLGWTLRAGQLLGRRPQEGRGLVELALRTALEKAPGRVVNNYVQLGDTNFHQDRYAAAVAYLEQALDESRRIGDRRMEWFVLSELTYALYMLGRWDESLARLAEIPDDQLGHTSNLLSPTNGVLEIYLQRGELERARALLVRFEALGHSGDVQSEGAVAAASAAVHVAAGELHEALSAGEQAFTGRETLGIGAQDVKQGYLHALEAAFALGDRARVAGLCEVVENVPAGLQPPLLAALARRFRARLADGDPSADDDYVAAAAQLRALELPFHVAVVLLEHGEWLVAGDRADDAEPLLAEARETFDRLAATPWLERLDALQAGEPAGIPA